MRQQMAYFHAQESILVFVMTVMSATYDMDARASPRKPYVVRRDRSENLASLEVVKRSARIGKSSCYFYVIGGGTQTGMSSYARGFRTRCLGFGEASCHHL